MTIPRPGKIVGVGRNYRDHASELGNTVPAMPLLFLKPATAVIGDGAAIALPADSTQVDFEGEIGVVIGSRLRRATEQEVRAGIAGITCVNDVTARDLQRTDEQWTRAKGFDTFCPLGPRVVPVDPSRYSDLEVRCRVNGAERQHGRASFEARPGVYPRAGDQLDEDRQRRRCGGAAPFQSHVVRITS